MSFLFLLAMAGSLALPPQQLEIANRVAGAGRPDCSAYHPDGTIWPCLPSFALRPGGTINGWDSGAQIFFTSAAAERLTPDEFSLLAGHEIAHWYLGHNGSTLETEIAADRLGAQLACQAGFNPVAGTSLFRYLRSGASHPQAAQRRAVVIGAGCKRGDANVLGG